MKEKNNREGYTVIPYPSADAWITTLETKVDMVLSDYFTTNYDQSTIFMNKLKSFQYTLAHCGHNPLVCRETVQDDLDILYGSYFKRCDISVDYSKVEGSETMYQLEISIGVSDGQNDFVGSKRILETNGTNYVRIMKINNDGYETEGEFDYGI